MSPQSTFITLSLLLFATGTCACTAYDAANDTGAVPSIGRSAQGISAGLLSPEYRLALAKARTRAMTDTNAHKAIDAEFRTHLDLARATRISQLEAAAPTGIAPSIDLPDVIPSHLIGNVNFNSQRGLTASPARASADVSIPRAVEEALGTHRGFVQQLMSELTPERWGRLHIDGFILMPRVETKAATENAAPMEIKSRTAAAMSDLLDLAEQQRSSPYSDEAAYEIVAGYERLLDNIRIELMFAPRVDSRQ